jgi:hypothetical protein
MTQSSAGDPGNLPEAKLPRRDWILLPLLGLMTLVLMAVSSELIARRYFGESKTSLNNCLVLNDAATGVRGIPNSVCWEKIPESPLIEYKLDCSGFRTGMACGPKPQGTYRIVMMGSSVAMGERVPIESTFATLLPKEISQSAGRRVELYNEAMGYGFPRNTVLRFNDVLAAKPDMILWVLTLIDVKLAGFLYPENPSKKPERPSSSQPRLMDSLKNSMKETVRAHAGNPVAGTLTALRHIVYQHQSQNEYIQSYLMLPQGAEGFWDAGPEALRTELNPEWQARLKEFDRSAADVERMASAAGVPLVAVLIPNRAQAAMISMGEWPAGFDPYTMDRELRSIITRHGGAYIDILPDFRGIPNAERHYYALDGHPDAGGHAIIAEFLARELSGGAVPGLSTAAHAQSTSQAEK